jgi:hypothetical protein
VSRDGTQALIDLLQSLFTAEELRRFVSLLPSSGAIANGLPSGIASLDALAFETVQALERHGLLDEAFFEQLKAQRPTGAAEISEVQARFATQAAPVATQVPPLPAENAHAHTPTRPTADRPARRYLDVLISIGAASNGHHPIEIRLGDGGVFKGGQLALDHAGLNLAALQFDDKEHGKKLWQALFASEEVRDGYKAAMGAVRSHRSPWRGLRVRLAIDANAPALHALGWERLYHKQEAVWGPLATAAKTPFSRYVALRGAHPAPPLRRSVRLLYAVANPAGVEDVLAPIDVDAEVANLCAALADIDQSRLGEVMVMPGRTGLSAERRAALEKAGFEIADGPTSRESIVARLQRGYDVFHFLGHGSYDRTAAQTTLHLEDDTGGWARVTDEDISGKLRDLHKPPRLVFLAACQSATRSEQDAFVGLAPKLVRAHVPAVVAMQDSVRMDQARTLTRHFYRNLFEHGIVDLAINQARSLLHEPGNLAWGIPVLFTRLKDGRLFARAKTEPAPAIPATPGVSGSVPSLLEPGVQDDIVAELERRLILATDAHSLELIQYEAEEVSRRRPDSAYARRVLRRIREAYLFARTKLPALLVFPGLDKDNQVESRLSVAADRLRQAGVVLALVQAIRTSYRGIDRALRRVGVNNRRRRLMTFLFSVLLLMWYLFPGVVYEYLWMVLPGIYVLVLCARGVDILWARAGRKKAPRTTLSSRVNRRRLRSVSSRGDMSL